MKDNDEWETVEAGETAKNGPAIEEEEDKDDFEEVDNVKGNKTPDATKDTTETPIRAEDLPDVPTEEPATKGEPAQKKQKSDHE